jgi:hypothetical protein
MSKMELTRQIVFEQTRRQKEVHRRVMKRLFDELLSAEAMSRIEQASRNKTLILPPEDEQGFFDGMLVGFCEQHPCAIAQHHLELRRRVLELLMEQKRADLEYEVEEELDREGYNDDDDEEDKEDE